MSRNCSLITKNERRRSLLWNLLWQLSLSYLARPYKVRHGPRRGLPRSPSGGRADGARRGAPIKTYLQTGAHQETDGRTGEGPLVLNVFFLLKKQQQQQEEKGWRAVGVLFTPKRTRWCAFLLCNRREREKGRSFKTPGHEVEDRVNSRSRGDGKKDLCCCCCTDPAVVGPLFPTWSPCLYTGRFYLAVGR